MKIVKKGVYIQRENGVLLFNGDGDERIRRQTRKNVFRG